jgi:hypothetical protein
MSLEKQEAFVDGLQEELKVSGNAQKKSAMIATKLDKKFAAMRLAYDELHSTTRRKL